MRLCIDSLFLNIIATVRQIERLKEDDCYNDIYLNHLEILYKLNKDDNFYQLCYLLMHLELKSNKKTLYIFSLLLKTRFENLEIKYYHLVIRILNHFIRFNYNLTFEHMEKNDIRFDTLINFELKYNELVSLIKKCFSINLKFWDKLSKSSYKNNTQLNIIFDGLVMSDTIIQTTQLFDELQKLYMNQTKALKLYSYYLSFILNRFAALSFTEEILNV